MPICKKCEKSFKNWVKIDGKNKNLQGRKYCLECSPFGKHNTSKLHLHGTVQNIKNGRNFVSHYCKCSICGREYIYSSNNKSGHTLTKCNSCCVNVRRKGVKKKAVEYKGGNCKICGYNKCIEALEFHHRDGKEKEFSLSSNHCYAWKRIQIELDKCDCLCANCHRELHANIDNGF